MRSKDYTFKVWQYTVGIFSDYSVRLSKQQLESRSTNKDVKKPREKENSSSDGGGRFQDNLLPENELDSLARNQGRSYINTAKCPPNSSTDPISVFPAHPL